TLSSVSVRGEPCASSASGAALLSRRSCSNCAAFCDAASFPQPDRNTASANTADSAAHFVLMVCFLPSLSAVLRSMELVQSPAVVGVHHADGVFDGEHLPLVSFHVTTVAVIVGNEHKFQDVLVAFHQPVAVRVGFKHLDGGAVGHGAAAGTVHQKV